MPNPTSPLDQLADIHLPDGVSWWPLAPGWWILLSLAVAILGVLFYWRRQRKHNAYRHIAKAELNQAYQQWLSAPEQTARYLQAFNRILKRTALTALPQGFDASIKGEDWLAWLDQHCPTLHGPHGFCQGLGRALLIGPYQKHPQLDLAALHQLGLTWIAEHRNQWQKLPASKSHSTNLSTGQLTETQQEATRV